MAQGMVQRILAVKKRLPAPIRRTLDRLVESDTWLARQMKSVLTVGQTIPEPLSPGEGNIRLLIAPMNYAGQGDRWARAAEERLSGVSARSQAVDVGAPFRFAVDDYVPAAVYVGSQVWQESQRVAVARFSHVLIESFASLYGSGTSDAAVVVAEAEELEASGVRVGMVCHGSDIRDPVAHRSRHPWSPFRHDAPGAEALIEAVANHKHALASFPGAVFVSTPDLLRDVPDATWLPVVVDPERWAIARRPALTQRTTRAIRVLHVPSVAGIKGTEFIAPIGKKLQTEGLLEYIELSGVPTARMPEEVATVDIVIDQLLLGSYGVAACEAMAASRLVIGNVDQDVRGFLLGSDGAELPIVQATPETLESVLREIVAQPELWRDRAQAGESFVRKIHDGRRAAAALREFLGLREDGPSTR